MADGGLEIVWRDQGGQIKLSTFIPLKIRKRGASKVVVRPDGQVEAAGKTTTQHDQPLCWWR